VANCDFARRNFVSTAGHSLQIRSRIPARPAADAASASLRFRLSEARGRSCHHAANPDQDSNVRANSVVSVIGLCLCASAYAPVHAAKLPAANLPPMVSITAPAAGTSVAPGSTLTLTAAASDADGKVAKVEFFRDGVLLGRDTAAPFAAVWVGVAAGSYTLTAVATDNARASTTSPAVVMSASAPGCAAPPAAPTGLQSPAQSQDSVGLQWNASAAGANCSLAYRVLRDGIEIGQTTATAFTAGALAADAPYRFAVRAGNQAGTSAASAELLVRTSPAGAAAGKRVLGYFTQWGIYQHGYSVKTLETRGAAAQLTHLAYAFGNVRDNRCELGVLQPTDEGTGAGGDAYADYSRTYSAAESVDGVADVWGQPLRGHWNQLRKLKQRHPGLKLTISLGGWTWSRGFASAARPENRTAFVASCIDAFIRGNLPPFDAAGGPGAAAGVFDGIDIDWEFPAACGLTCGSSEDSANFTALLAEFRRQLDAVRPGLLLSVAAGAGIDKIRVTDPGQYQAHVDYINLMSYDFHGGWETRTNFHSALFGSPADPATGDAARYNTHDAVQALLERGVPAAKINLGIASYGHGWSGVGSAGNGLYQFGAAASGSLGAGSESYRVLRARNAPEFFDAQTLARWSYDGDEFWSVDTPASIADKMAYVRTQGVGGAFLWDFTGDDDASALLQAIGNGLR
jgi:chitinase